VLREIYDVMQDDPSNVRRWFHDDDFDLYTRETGESWWRSSSATASTPTSGPWCGSRGGAFSTTASRPGLHRGEPCPGDSLDADPIIARFKEAAGGLPETLRLGWRGVWASSPWETRGLGAPDSLSPRRLAANRRHTETGSIVERPHRPETCMDTIKPLFTATATATGGRNGHTSRATAW